jgi:hypothetical protein
MVAINPQETFGKIRVKLETASRECLLSPTSYTVLVGNGIAVAKVYETPLPQSLIEMKFERVVGFRKAIRYLGRVWGLMA